MRSLGQYLVARAEKTPYFHLQDYMLRYWLVPYADPELGNGCGPVSFWRRPAAWVLQHLGIAVRIHHILRSDDARAFHDHPWSYITCILSGGYIEVTPELSSNLYGGELARWRKPGSVLFRRAKSWHRLVVLTDHEPTTTLFITFRKTQSWGFLTTPRFKTYYKDYK